MLASVLWGVAYVLGARLLQSIHVQTLLLLELGCGTVTFLFWSIITHSLKLDLQIASKNGALCKQLLLSVLAFNTANMLILWSVKDKNAVLASLLEVSYPLFVLLFAWLFFREVHMTPVTAVGGLLILAGVMMVSWHNR